MSFHYDASKISEQEFPLLPEGWHMFKIVDAEEMKSKKGNDMILAKCQVINDSEWGTTVIWHYVTFLPAESKGAFINVMFRRAIGVPHEGHDEVNADDWVGKRFMGSVVHETYESKTRPKIDKVSPIREDAKEVIAAVAATTPGGRVKPRVDAVKTKEEDDEIPF